MSLEEFEKQSSEIFPRDITDIQAFLKGKDLDALQTQTKNIYSNINSLLSNKFAGITIKNGYKLIDDAFSSGKQDEIEKEINMLDNKFEYTKKMFKEYFNKKSN